MKLILGQVDAGNERSVSSVIEMAQKDWLSFGAQFDAHVVHFPSLRWAVSIEIPDEALNKKSARDLMCMVWQIAAGLGSGDYLFRFLDDEIDIEDFFDLVICQEINGLSGLPFMMTRNDESIFLFTIPLWYVANLLRHIAQEPFVSGIDGTDPGYSVHSIFHALIVAIKVEGPWKIAFEYHRPYGTAFVHRTLSHGSRMPN